MYAGSKIAYMVYFNIFHLICKHWLLNVHQVRLPKGRSYGKYRRINNTHCIDYAHGPCVPDEDAAQNAHAKI